MNPQQLLMAQFQQNPLFKRAEEMAKGKSPQEIEQIAINLCKQRGLNFDEALQQFKQLYSQQNH